MKKKELINLMAEGADISKVAAAKVLDAYYAVVGKELKKSGKFRMAGFGTVSVVRRIAREGGKAQTGKRM